MVKHAGERYTIAVDFDGVLHSYSSPWVAEELIQDPPVPGAIEWLTGIMKKFDVVIFTTRGKTAGGRVAVREWLIEYGFDYDTATRIRITHEKVPALLYIDDRAWRFRGPGSFPTAEQIHDARPWNKPRTE